VIAARRKMLDRCQVIGLPLKVDLNARHDENKRCAISAWLAASRDGYAALSLEPLPHCVSHATRGQEEGGQGVRGCR
jgi:hypothetical protein